LLSPVPALRPQRGIFQEDIMLRFSALAAAMLALSFFIGSSLVQAQTTYDPKSQPGPQCRLSNGQRC
jgi:hypothetical protein